MRTKHNHPVLQHLRNIWNRLQYPGIILAYRVASFKTQNLWLTAPASILNSLQVWNRNKINRLSYKQEMDRWIILSVSPFFKAVRRPKKFMNRLLQNALQHICPSKTDIPPCDFTLQVIKSRLNCKQRTVVPPLLALALSTLATEAANFLMLF